MESRLLGIQTAIGQVAMSSTSEDWPHVPSDLYKEVLVKLAVAV